MSVVGRTFVDIDEEQPMLVTPSGCARFFVEASASVGRAGRSAPAASGLTEDLVVAVRVDDANGAHFYVLQPSGPCTTTMTAPKQTAAMLDAQGDHTGALSVFETVMAACESDRQTLSLAFEYACNAGDREAARKYWRKLPADLQRMLEPLCARHEITREALDGP